LTKDNVFVFNNISNVVILSIDITTMNYLFKPMFTPNKDEFISFINTGKGDLLDVVFVGQMAKRLISFFDVQENVKLFDIQIEDT
jgi:hypothetical protein